VAHLKFSIFRKIRDLRRIRNSIDHIYTVCAIATSLNHSKVQGSLYIAVGAYGADQG